MPLLRGMAIPVLLAQLKVASVKILAATSRTSDVREVEWSAPVAILIGSEGAGLPASAANGGCHSGDSDERRG